MHCRNILVSPTKECRRHGTTLNNNSKIIYRGTKYESFILL